MLTECLQMLTESLLKCWNINETRLKASRCRWKDKKYNEKAMSMRLIHNDILLCACRRLNDYNGRFVNYIFCL